MLDVDAQAGTPDDTFRILVATDVHLGYNEKDPIRGNDSFNSFEEVLQIAQQQEVDFVLLGGDLFDSNKPTQYSMQRTVDILKKYSFGDKPIQFHLVQQLDDSDDELSEKQLPTLNFYDPNINIGMPIFSIHGNHDDPAGMKSVSSLDTLSSMGLVNYLGRWDKVEDLEVVPIMLAKGSTRLAIYGVGHMPDKRLARLFREDKVVIHAVDPDTSFQLMVLHQNRANRGNLNFIQFTCIPQFMDLVIWGHEHDCYIEPEPQNNVYFSQPGSTVATSLTDGEARPKHVGLLSVHKKSFHMEAIPLQTVRPLVFRHLFIETPKDILAQGVSELDLSLHSEKKVMKEIEEMLQALEDEKAKNIAANLPANNMLPLLRLVVQYVDERQGFNDKKIAFHLDGRVANPGEVILQKRTIMGGKVQRGAKGLPTSLDNDGAPNAVFNNVNEFVRKELEANVTNCRMSTVSGLVETMDRFADYNDLYAFEEYARYRRDKFMSAMEKLIVTDDNDDDLDKKIETYLASSRDADETKDVQTLLTNPQRKATDDAPGTASNQTLNGDSDDDNWNKSVTVAKRGRGGRGGRPRGTRGTRGRAKK